MNIVVKTRSHDDFLYDRMASFIPSSVQGFAYTGYDTWRDASNFLHEAIESSFDMLLILDEDAFVVQWEAVEQLCAQMKVNGFTHAGVPDGGIIDHRRHSFLTMNPFFVIFDCGLLKAFKSKFARDEIDRWIYNDRMKHLRPTWVNENYENDCFEPFAGLFYWLAENGKPLFLKASTLSDGISTAVYDLNNSILCLHAWYSRLYNQDENVKQRIDALYESAKALWKPQHSTNHNNIM